MNWRFSELVSGGHFGSKFIDDINFPMIAATMPSMFLKYFFVVCSLGLTQLAINIMPPKRTLSSSASPSKKRKSGPAQSGFKDGNLDFFFNKQIHKTSLGESSSSNTSMPLVNTQADDERVALKLAEEDGTELETIVKLEQEWKTSVLPRTKQPNIEVIDVDELPDGRVSTVKRKLNILSSSLLLLQLPFRVLSIEIHFRAIRRIRNLIRKLL